MRLLLALRTLPCLLIACAAVNLSNWASAQADPLFDHHVHLLSPDLIRHWKSLGMQFSRPDDAYSDPLKLFENHRLSGALLISMAHLYTSEDFRGVVQSTEDERRWVAAENDFVAACVAQAPQRLIGYCSVSPLREYSLEELNRCRTKLNLRGIKLHLPACGVDWNNEHHRARLAEVLDWASRNEMPVLLHFSAGEPLSMEDARTFWNGIIGPHDRLELYLAHLGSVGGFNNSSQHVLEAYHQICAEDALFGARRIFFDLSGAIIPQGSEEAAPTSDERCLQLSKLMQQIGVDKFVFASDYPVFSIEETRASLEQRLTLSPEELDRLLDNMPGQRPALK